MSALALLNTGGYANATSVTANLTSAATTYVVPTFTTTYTYCAQAADTTTVWEATYTIVEVVCGEPETWTVPAVPPFFVESTVLCNEQVQTITCPVVEAECASTVSICGNGVTAAAGAWAKATASATAAAAAAATATTTIIGAKDTTTCASAGPTAYHNSSTGTAVYSKGTSATATSWVVTAGAASIRGSLTLIGATVLLVGPFFL